MRHWLFFVLCAAGTGATHPAAADVFDEISGEISRAFDYLVPDAWQDEDIRLAVGGGSLVAPDYHGSDNYGFRLLPIIDFRWGDALIFETDQLKLVAVNSPVRAGVITKLDFGRNENDNSALMGLGNVGTALEAGGFVETMMDNWALRFNIRQDIASGHEGMVATLTLGRFHDINDRLRLIGGTRVNWSNGRYMRSFFGITPAQAAASQYAAFDPSGGIRDVGVQVVGAYRATDSLTIQSGIGYQRLIGDAADSPLVKDVGSPNQVIFGVTFRYSVLTRND